MERRNTIQKELVLNAVRSLKSHATADEIYAYIKEGYPSIGRGTVYRNLNILAEDGVIRRVSFPGEPDRYDHAIEEHYHIRCIKCGRVFDVKMKPIADLSDCIQDKQGFTFLGFDMFFSGICPDCNENETINGGK